MLNSGKNANNRQKTASNAVILFLFVNIVNSLSFSIKRQGKRLHKRTEKALSFNFILVNGSFGQKIRFSYLFHLFFFDKRDFIPNDNRKKPSSRLAPGLRNYFSLPSSSNFCLVFPNIFH